MDTESLQSLGWLLIWGGLFFVMMRYGCGAHMMGGHGHGNNHGKENSGGNSKDPVCGMAVEPQKAAALAVRNGNTYCFCSTSCRNKFEQEPDKYLGKTGGHHA